MYPEVYTSLLKVYQEANPTKKRDIAIQEAQDLQEQTPAQNKLKEDLIQLNRELSQLQNIEDKGLIADADSDRKKIIQNEILVSSKALSKLESQQNIQQNYKDRKRQKLRQVEDQLRAAGINTQLIRSVGYSRLEEAQPEMIRFVKTLDQLQAALKQMNYKISHSATYLRLLPKRFNTKEGKRYIKTVPVKLLRSQNTARKRHEDTHFCSSLVRNIKEIVHYWDLKARIPLGLAIANKQALILMKLEYRVELPDYDWVVAEKHKLIPSVYAILEMQSGKYGNVKAIIYSGPTFIRICSGKHDTSTTYIHSKDFDDLMSDEILYNFTTTEDGQSKPVVLMLSDGGPDKNSRYKKTIQVMIEHFIKYDLDTIIVVCFAPYQSASNPVERRMASLSHDLAGIILPHDTFGSHLDEQLKTADDELEKRNFKAAGEILAFVWENTVINSYPVLVEYIDPEEHDQSRLDEKSAAWIERHTMTCHYITQVVKCNDTSCCRPFCSGILQLFPNQLKKSLKCHIQKCPYKSSNSLMDNRGFQDTDHLVCPIVVIHNYQYGKFLVSNNKDEAMWIEEDTIPEDVPESLFQEVKHIRTNQDNQAYLID
ncbi:40509_t:CDS:2 [Gigaspora margarita]|uniref:40509_t:CDS:1 n=1 Tax=Gigaspora margarita TaxID=4874 RepID=A0ABN7UG60_GIGMA|nr:40509_t:CDS:2 [Gigaspora margarita]